MGFWWGHMQKCHDSPRCKRYILNCWGKAKKGLSYFLLPTTLNGCFYTCARNCDQYLHPSICVHMLQVCNFHRLGGITYVQDRRPGYVVTGLFGPRNVRKNIMPIASQHVEPYNTKWEKIIQSNTNGEEIIQSVQTVCQRFDMLPRFLIRELKDTGPISGLPVM